MFSIDFSSISDTAVLDLAKEKLKTAPEHWEKYIWEFIVRWFDSSIESIPVLSSGSTGPPRITLHSKQAMLNSAAATCRALQLHPGSSALLCLPADKISGMMMLVRSLYNKMNLLCLRPSLSILSELPANLEIGFAAFTPAQFSEILYSDKPLNRAGSIHKIILGGETIQPALLDKIKTLPNQVYATFGMTETISHIALKRLNGKEPDQHYKALPGIELSADERGCLIIKAPGLFEKPLVTNDIVQLFSITEFDWLGRADNVVNSGGIKVYPEQVEALLSAFIKRPFFIAGLPDVRFGEKLVLAMEATQLSEQERTEITNPIKQLSKHLQPKEIVLIPNFIRTENGKLRRKESLHEKASRISL